jgi:hypothetical protein
LKMGPIRCPETSVNNYHTTPRNIPEERKSLADDVSCNPLTETLFLYSDIQRCIGTFPVSYS